MAAVRRRPPWVTLLRMPGCARFVRRVWLLGVLGMLILGGPGAAAAWTLLFALGLVMAARQILGGPSRRKVRRERRAALAARAARPQQITFEGQSAKLSASQRRWARKTIRRNDPALGMLLDVMHPVPSKRKAREQSEA